MTNPIGELRRQIDDIRTRAHEPGADPVELIKSIVVVLDELLIASQLPRA